MRTEDVCRLLADMGGLEMLRTDTFRAKVLIGPVKLTLAAAQVTEKWRNRELEF